MEKNHKTSVTLRLHAERDHLTIQRETTPETLEKSVPEQPYSVRGRRRRVSSQGGSRNHPTPPIPEHGNSHVT